MSQTSAPRVTIVIPNWNGRKHLERCLPSLSAQSFGDFETVVVDNGSTDDCVAWLRSTWPEVRVIELGENRGFPAAVNAGIEATSTEYVVLLNNDTVAEPDWLKRLVTAMDARPGYAFGSSKLLRLEDRDVIDSAGHTYSLWLGASDNIGESEDAKLYDRPAWIFGACAAAGIYRRSLFDDIGLFDAEFFFTHEDVEFDIRANAAGYRGLLVPDAIVYHARGASYEVSPEIHLLGIRNRIWAAGKNLPPGLFAAWVAGKILRIFWWLPVRLLGRVPSRPGRRPGSAGRTEAWKNVRPTDIARAFLDAVRRLPAKRAEVRSVRRVSSRQLWAVLRATRRPRPID